MKSKISVFIALCTFTYFIIGCNDNKTSAEKDKNDTAISQGTDVSMDTMHHMDNMQMKMDNELMSSMTSMMGNMRKMSMTGDFDIDFANMMIQHHQGAIDMSQYEVSNGKNDKLKSMAQKIISSQKEEIAKLQGFVKNYKPSGMKHGEGTLQKSITGMDEKMKAMHMSGDIDKDYASMMITHHEGAVDMAKKQLSNGMSSKLKQTAQKTIDDQTKEITEFQNWLIKK